MMAMPDEPFLSWPGSRGRASEGHPWGEDIVRRFLSIDEESIRALTLKQVFFHSYLKRHLKKSFADPYDVDGFVVSYSGRVLPIEIKEKSPTPDGFFGVDVGRIMMLLRFCLATNSNGLYLIRQVQSEGHRQFISWLYITLSDLILGCNLNLRAGGLGMTGSATQTLMIHAHFFQTFTVATLSEDWIIENAGLQEATKRMIKTLSQQLKNYL